MSKLPQSKQTVQIVALDLDDTLLKHDLTISDYTVDILQKVVEKGIYVMLCSGRIDDAMLPYVRQLDIAGSNFGRYMITQNGTNILDLHLRLSIYSHQLDYDIAMHVYNLLEEYGVTAHVYDSSFIFTCKYTEWGDKDAILSGLNKELIEDYPEFLKRGFPKMVIPGEPETLKILEARLKKEIGDRCVIFTSKPFFLEVLPKNAGKGEALVWIAEQLNVPIENVMGFGDSMNDESMMNLAGKSVAMINGLDHIKDIAVFNTEFSNDEDGVAKFIEKFVL